MYKMVISSAETILIEELSQKKTMNTLNEEMATVTLARNTPDDYARYAFLVGTIIDGILIRSETDEEVFRDERPYIVLDLRRTLTDHGVSHMMQLRYFTPMSRRVKDVMADVRPPSSSES